MDQRSKKKQDKLDSRLAEGNVYLNLKKIKIKNFDKWSQINSENDLIT